MAARRDRIELHWCTHPRDASCRYAELLVNGRPLREQVERATRRPCDFLPPLGWTAADYQRQYIERLLLRQPPVLSTGRREILVCPLCADLGCGCVSAVMELRGDVVRWTELGLENDYDPDSLAVFGMASLSFRYADLERLLPTHGPAAAE